MGAALLAWHELRRILRATLARRKESDSKRCCKKMGEMFHGVVLTYCTQLGAGTPEERSGALIA